MARKGVVRQGMAFRGVHETNIEARFREAIESRGLRRGIDFATQFPLRHSFILDFAFPDKMVAVEVDGRKWHSSPEARKRDGFKNHILKRLGWMVFRFWEEEILEDVEGCVDKVLDALDRAKGIVRH